MIAKASTNTNNPDGGVAASLLAFQGSGEPPLAEVIADDTVRRMMDRDGVDLDQLLVLLDEVRTRLT